MQRRSGTHSFFSVFLQHCHVVWTELWFRGDLIRLSIWLTGPWEGRWATMETSWSSRATATAAKASCLRASPCRLWWGAETHFGQEVTWRRAEVLLSSWFLFCLTDHRRSETYPLRAGEVWRSARRNRPGGGNRVRWACWSHRESDGTGSIQEHLLTSN